MPVVDGASELTTSLRRRGAIVVLCTTRPYLSLEGVDEDTRHWASRSKVAHDFIIWGENKYRDLSRFGSRVVGVLDDEPVMLRQALDCDIMAIAINRPYNRDAEAGAYAPDLFAAKDYMHKQLDIWEEANR